MNHFDNSNNPLNQTTVGTARLVQYYCREDPSEAL